MTSRLAMIRKQVLWLQRETRKAIGTPDEKKILRELQCRLTQIHRELNKCLRSCS